MPHVDEDVGDALLVRIDPERPPPLGSNGFLVRREAVLQTRYRPFVHSDVAGDLAAAGWRFARVKDGIVHHHADGFAAYARKARRRAERGAAGLPVQRRGFRPSRARTLFAALSALTLVVPILQAARGYRRRADPAWALVPLLLAINVVLQARSRLGRRPQPAAASAEPVPVFRP